MIGIAHQAYFGLQKFAQWPLEKEILAYLGCRSITSYMENRSSKLCAVIKKIRVAVVALDFGAALWTVASGIDFIEKRFQFSHWILQHKALFDLFSLVGLVSGSIITVKLIGQINSAFEQKNLGGFDFAHPESRIGIQAFPFVGAVANVALALLATFPYFHQNFAIFHAGCAVMQGITFLNHAKEKWIRQTITIDGKEKQSIVFSLFFRLFEQTGNPKRENVDCADKGKPVDTYFCDRHATYHTDCLARSIHEKNEAAIRKGAKVLFKKGHRWPAYHITLPRGSLSICPELHCSKPPFDEELSVEVRGKFSGKRRPYAVIRYADGVVA